jgi:transposase
MGKVTKAVGHLSESEIKDKIKETVGFWRVQKWLVILNALIDSRPAREIALHTGLAVGTVHNLISSYNRQGPCVIETPGKGGRRRAYLSIEQEEKFLESFIEKASSGQISTVREIKKALEKRLGHEIHKTTVYRLLKRHGWRKITPRPFHVQAKKEEQERFKKNFRI